METPQDEKIVPKDDTSDERPRPSDADPWRWLGQAALRYLESHEAKRRGRSDGVETGEPAKRIGAALSNIRTVTHQLRARGLVKWSDQVGRGGSAAEGGR
jgi:hypothetical protein